MNVDKNLKMRRLCGDRGHDPQALAALFPAVEAFRLNLAALVSPQFPVNVLGSVLQQCVIMVAWVAQEFQLETAAWDCASA